MDESKRLLDTVRASYQTVGAPGSVLLGLSGGADSLALMFLLQELQKEVAFELSCVHVNHHLRREADEEAAWLRSLLSGMSVPLLVKDVNVPQGASLEAQARQVRYTAFHQALMETGAQVLALAHHADDQAETMLMRLMHGTGPSGLCAMGERNGNLWRPLLLTPKALLIDFLKQRNQRWIEDATNSDLCILRNAVRHRVTPEMERLSPGAMLRMAKTALLLRDEETAWAAFETRWLWRHARLTPPMVFLMTDPFLSEPLAFRRRLVRRLCGVYRILLDQAQTDALCALPNNVKPDTMNLPRDARALCTRSRLHILFPEPERMHSPEGRLEADHSDTSVGDGRRVQAFDADRLQGAKLRCVRRGDRITPLGMSGSKSMGKYLSDLKIDLPFRTYWPVLAQGSQVLWAIGLGMAQTAAVTADTKNRIRYVYKGALPGDLQQKTEEG